MKPRPLSIAVLTIVVCILILGSLLISHPEHDAAMLERLAPRIERAQVLAPETRDAIASLLDRLRRDPDDPRHDARSHAAIERVSEALKAKDAGPELSSVGQGNVAP